MSGSTIGGVVGGVIGFVVSGFNPAGAMWGWQIGSLVGAIVDPDVIEGPRLQESRTQTATDGVALTYGYGTYRCAGNVTWVDEVKEHRHNDDGKGGPTQVTYTYTLSYMVTVCKGRISGYKMIRRNGKIVYDARTDAELTALGYTSQEISETRAAQAEFLQRATLYYGTNDQMPDPTMVAVLGAGNVPAYTGVAYIVMTDDETREGEYAQFEFVVANCGERHEGVMGEGWIGFGRAETGLRAAVRPLTYTGQWLGDADTIVGANDTFVQSSAVVGSTVYVHLNSTDVLYADNNDLGAWSFAATHPYSGSSAHIAGYDGTLWAWSATNPYLYRLSNSGDSFELVNTMTGGYVSSDIMAVASDGGNVICVGRYGQVWASHNSGATFSVMSVAGGGGVSLAAPALDHSNGRYVFGGMSGLTTRVFFTGDYGATIHESTFAGAAPSASVTQVKHIAGGLWLLALNLPSSNVTGLYLSIDNAGSFSPVTTPENLYFQTPGRSIAVDHVSGRVVVAGAVYGTAANKMYYSDDLSEWTEVPLGGTAALTIGEINDPEYVTRLTPVPDAPGFFVNPRTGQIVGPSGTQIDPCQPTLGEIVASQCDKRGVDSRDVSELTDLVGGYRIAKPASPLANIQGLQPAYFFGASEFDGKLHFPKRGRDLTFALTYDDMVEREGDLIQWERVQERDLLRKVTVAYTDPATNYADTTQQAERRSATVNAEGESVMELPITGDKDWAAQVADKSIKVAWGEPDECTFHVSIAHAELVTGAEGTVPYTDGTPTVVRIERIDDEGLVRMVHARKTRPHLYESNASGAAKPLPRFPGSNARGPTDGLLMNLPVLLDQDDRPGIHWAASGMMSGWQGGQLQIRRAGQWTVAGTVYNPAGMGTLLDPLPAHAGDVDTANVLRVQFNEPLESVTLVNLLQERNPFAILREDGTAEIIQAQTATATAPGEYELTTLLRRRLATTTSDHPVGARIVFLDQRVQYATLEPTDVGTTLEYRFVSVGTDPDAAPIQTLDLTTMESQREWPVADLSVEVDGDDYILTWLRRDRLGTDVLPIRSANLAGYEVSYSWSGGSGSVVVTDETHTFTIPGASDITFSVAQLNQYTGAGPSKTVTVP